MLRKTRMAALVVVVTLTLSGLALAHDDNDYRDNSARQNGYQHGYSDGFRHGRDDREDHRSYNFHGEDWEHANHGYAEWMGSYGQFKKSYRDGYRQGYDAGFYAGGASRGNGFGGERVFDNDHPNHRDEFPGLRVARDSGYADGCAVARQDMAKGKPYNPNPRGKHHDADHGCRREYGDKRDYREVYARAYREGYESVFFRR